MKRKNRASSDQMFDMLSVYDKEFEALRKLGATWELNRSKKYYYALFRRWKLWEVM